MTVVPILKTALLGGAVLTLAVALIGGGIGFAIDGGRGLAGALIGAAASFVFLGLTAVSIILAGRLTGGDMLNPAYFGVILGGLLVKFAVFFVLAQSLRGQEWLNPSVMFWAVIASVLGSLVVDTLAFGRSRVPYVSDLPSDSSPR